MYPLFFFFLLSDAKEKKIPFYVNLRDNKVILSLLILYIFLLLVLTDTIQWTSFSSFTLKTPFNPVIYLIQQLNCINPFGELMSHSIPQFRNLHNEIRGHVVLMEISLFSFLQDMGMDIIGAGQKVIVF